MDELLEIHVNGRVTALDCCKEAWTIDSTRGRCKQTDFPAQSVGEKRIPGFWGGGSQSHYFLHGRRPHNCSGIYLIFILWDFQFQNWFPIVPSWLSEFGVEEKNPVRDLIGEKKPHWLLKNLLPILPAMSSLFTVNIFSPYFLINMTVIFSRWFHETNLHLRCIFWDLGSDETGIASLNRAPYASFCVCLLPPKYSQIISLAEYMTKYQKGVSTQMLTLLQKRKSDKCFTV